jgi:hypothetical protein
MLSFAAEHLIGGGGDRVARPADQRARRAAADCGEVGDRDADIDQLDGAREPAAGTGFAVGQELERDVELAQVGEALRGLAIARDREVGAGLLRRGGAIGAAAGGE